MQLLDFPVHFIHVSQLLERLLISISDHILYENVD